MSSSNTSARPARVLLVGAIPAFIGIGYAVASQVALPPVLQNIPTQTALVLIGFTIISMLCFVAFVLGALGKDPSSKA